MLEFVPASKKRVGNLYPFYSTLELPKLNYGVHVDSIQKISSFLAVKKKKANTKEQRVPIPAYEIPSFYDIQICTTVNAP